uniref:Uncharacterized protein n=1 Tax=Globodera rostochiensis TaxID=31243 RepID=A0A914HPE6_GLORO
MKERTDGRRPQNVDPKDGKIDGQIDASSTSAPIVNLPEPVRRKGQKFVSGCRSDYVPSEDGTFGPLKLCNSGIFLQLLRICRHQRLLSRTILVGWDRK